MGFLIIRAEGAVSTGLKRPHLYRFCSRSKTCHRRGRGTYSKIVSKFSLASARFPRYDSAKRQMAMHLVDGARSLLPAHDLDRGSKRDCRLYDSLCAQMIRFKPALYASGARYSSSRRLLVVIGADLGIRFRADSTFPVLADGAGGFRLR